MITGGFGTVVEALHKTSKQQVAIKFISKITAASTVSVSIEVEEEGAEEEANDDLKSSLF